MHSCKYDTSMYIKYTLSRLNKWLHDCKSNTKHAVFKTAVCGCDATGTATAFAKYILKLKDVELHFKANYLI